MIFLHANLISAAKGSRKSTKETVLQVLSEEKWFFFSSVI
jgi:hypothetical protein